MSDAFWICRSGRIYGVVVRRNHTPRHSGTLDIACQLTSEPLLDRLARRQTHASANLCSQHFRMDSLQQRYLALTYVYYIYIYKCTYISVYILTLAECGRCYLVTTGFARGFHVPESLEVQIHNEQQVPTTRRRDS